MKINDQKNYHIFLLLTIIFTREVLAKEINKPEDCLWGDISIRGQPTCNNLIDDNIALERRNIECKITLKSKDALNINASSMTVYLEMRAKSSINEKWLLYDQTSIRNGEPIKESELWNETNSIIFLNEPVPWTIEWRIACVNETDEKYLESVTKTIYVQPASAFKDLEYSKTLQELYKEQLKGQQVSIANQLLAAIIAGTFTIFGVIISFSLNERKSKKEKTLRALEEIHADMVNCFFKLNEAGNIHPKTLAEYKYKVESPKDKFENSLNVNSIRFDKPLLDALNEVRSAFRQVSMAIWMNLPNTELPKGFSIESYPKDYRRIDWMNFNKTFENVRKLIRKEIRMTLVKSLDSFYKF